MFIGNDFGSILGFSKLKLHAPPTWRHFRTRLLKAGRPGQLGFYTNAFLGLWNDRDALVDPISYKDYSAFCREFLEFQLTIQMPQLVVVLGERPSGLLRQVVQLPPCPLGEIA